MEQVVIPRFGPPEVLEVETRATPEPGAGAVRVAIRAAGVNFADILARLGLSPDAPRPPLVVGYEFAGVVDAVGRSAAHRLTIPSRVPATRTGEPPPARRRPAYRQGGR